MAGETGSTGDRPDPAQMEGDVEGGEHLDAEGAPHFWDAGWEKTKAFAGGVASKAREYRDVIHEVNEGPDPREPTPDWWSSDRFASPDHLGFEDRLHWAELAGTEASRAAAQVAYDIVSHQGEVENDPGLVAQFINDSVAHARGASPVFGKALPADDEAAFAEVQASVRFIMEPRRDMGHEIGDDINIRGQQLEPSVTSRFHRPGEQDDHEDHIREVEASTRRERSAAHNRDLGAGKSREHIERLGARTADPDFLTAEQTARLNVLRYQESNMGPYVQEALLRAIPDALQHEDRDTRAQMIETVAKSVVRSEFADTLNPEESPVDRPMTVGDINMAPGSPHGMAMFEYDRLVESPLVQHSVDSPDADIEIRDAAEADATELFDLAVRNLSEEIQLVLYDRRGAVETHAERRERVLAEHEETINDLAMDALQQVASPTLHDPRLGDDADSQPWIIADIPEGFEGGYVEQMTFLATARAYSRELNDPAAMAAGEETPGAVYDLADLPAFSESEPTPQNREVTTIDTDNELLQDVDLTREAVAARVQELLYGPSDALRLVDDAGNERTVSDVNPEALFYQALNHEESPDRLTPESLEQPENRYRLAAMARVRGLQNLNVLPDAEGSSGFDLDNVDEMRNLLARINTHERVRMDTVSRARDRVRERIQGIRENDHELTVDDRDTRINAYARYALREGMAMDAINYLTRHQVYADPTPEVIDRAITEIFIQNGSDTMTDEERVGTFLEAPAIARAQLRNDLLEAYRWEPQADRGVSVLDYRNDASMIEIYSLANAYGFSDSGYAADSYTRRDLWEMIARFEENTPDTLLNELREAANLPRTDALSTHEVDIKRSSGDIVTKTQLPLMSEIEVVTTTDVTTVNKLIIAYGIDKHDGYDANASLDDKRQLVIDFETEALESGSGRRDQASGRDLLNIQRSLSGLPELAPEGHDPTYAPHRLEQFDIADLDGMGQRERDARLRKYYTLAALYYKERDPKTGDPITNSLTPDQLIVRLRNFEMGNQIEAQRLRIENGFGSLGPFAKRDLDLRTLNPELTGDRRVIDTYVQIYRINTNDNFDENDPAARKEAYEARLATLVQMEASQRQAMGRARREAGMPAIPAPEVPTRPMDARGFDTTDVGTARDQDAGVETGRSSIINLAAEHNLSLAAVKGTGLSTEARYASLAAMVAEREAANPTRANLIRTRHDLPPAFPENPETQWPVLTVEEDARLQEIADDPMRAHLVAPILATLRAMNNGAQSGMLDQIRGHSGDNEGLRRRRNMLLREQLTAVIVRYDTGNPNRRTDLYTWGDIERAGDWGHRLPDNQRGFSRPRQVRIAAERALDEILGTVPEPVAAATTGGAADGGAGGPGPAGGGPAGGGGPGAGGGGGGGPEGGGPEGDPIPPSDEEVRNHWEAINAVRARQGLDPLPMPIEVSQLLSRPNSEEGEALAPSEEAQAAEAAVRTSRRRARDVALRAGLGIRNAADSTITYLMGEVDPDETPTRRGRLVRRGAQLALLGAVVSVERNLGEGVGLGEAMQATAADLEAMTQGGAIDPARAAVGEAVDRAVIEAGDALAEGVLAASDPEQLIRDAAGKLEEVELGQAAALVAGAAAIRTATGFADRWIPQLSSDPDGVRERIQDRRRVREAHLINKGLEARRRIDARQNEVAAARARIERGTGRPQDYILTGTEEELAGAGAGGA